MGPRGKVDEFFASVAQESWGYGEHLWGGNYASPKPVKGGEKLGQRGGGKNRPLPVREGVDLLDRAGVAGAEACASVQAARLGRSGRHPSPIVATCGEG